MKLIPILFSSAMVQALLAGTKTQTRRNIKPQPTPEPARFTYYGETGLALSGWVPESNSGKVGIFEPAKYKCPYGKPGDVLWVRESWQPYDGTFTKYLFRADATDIDSSSSPFLDHIKQVWRNENGVDLPCVAKWRPSLHMPKAACRIWLEVVSVRVERLNDITTRDAIDEGISIQDNHCLNYLTGQNDLLQTSLIGNDPHNLVPAEVYSYLTLWESINGAESRAANPWVWVVEFKRVEKPEQA